MARHSQPVPAAPPRGGAHLAVVRPEYLDLIVSGRKTIESRLTRTRREPFGRVRAGDRVYFKAVGGPVRCVAVARRVMYVEGLSPGRVEALRARFNRRVLGTRAYWSGRRQARYATLVWLGDVRPVAEPWHCAPLHGRGWLTLSDHA